MRWVDVNEQLPVPQRRVLVAMHAGTEGIHYYRSHRLHQKSVTCVEHGYFDDDAAGH